MIELVRINNETVIVNACHIVCVEPTPDTLLTLTTGEKLLVRNSLQEVIDKTTKYLRELGRGPTVASVATIAGTKSKT